MTFERVIWPDVFMAMTSSPSATTRPPTRDPRSSLSFMALMPSPPRFCSRYSETGVRFANPPSVTVNTNRSSSGMSAPMTVMLSSASSERNFMPVTPEVARPIGRSCSSVAANLIAWPLRDTSSTWSSALHSEAPISSSSSSRKFTAMTPACRGVSNAVSWVFFTRPFRVARRRYAASSYDLIASTCAILSSGWKLSNPATCPPLASRLPSGSSHAFVR